MDVVGIDPRDQTWQDDAPRYRVHFFEGATSDEYEVSGAPDVRAVVDWADPDETDPATFTISCPGGT